MSPLTVDSFLFCSSLGIKIVCKEFSVNGFQAQIPTVVLSNIFFVIVQCCVIRVQNFYSLTQRVAFNPAPLMISHSPKPLTFYAEQSF